MLESVSVCCLVAAFAISFPFEKKGSPVTAGDPSCTEAVCLVVKAVTPCIDSVLESLSDGFFQEISMSQFDDLRKMLDAKAPPEMLQPHMLRVIALALVSIAETLAQKTPKD